MFAQDAEDKARDTIIERVWASIRQEIDGKFQKSIEEDTIVVVADDTALPRTGKLNFIRPRVYLKYKDSINAAYNHEGGSGAGMMGSVKAGTNLHKSEENFVESTPSPFKSAVMAIDMVVL